MYLIQFDKFIISSMNRQKRQDKIIYLNNSEILLKFLYCEQCSYNNINNPTCDILNL